MQLEALVSLMTPHLPLASWISSLHFACIWPAAHNRKDSKVSLAAKNTILHKGVLFHLLFNELSIKLILNGHLVANEVKWGRGGRGRGKRHGKDVFC